MKLIELVLSEFTKFVPIQIYTISSSYQNYYDEMIIVDPIISRVIFSALRQWNNVYR